MRPVQVFARVLVFLGPALLSGIAGCADGGDGTPRRDGGRDGAIMDSGSGEVDAFVPPVDSGHDAGVDAFVPDPVGTCETCETNVDCEVGSYCANLVTGGRACLPGCVPDLPECPRSFSCIFDATGTGVDATICAPIGGPCCVDEDGDGYGTGVGCMGPDCNDADPDVHPDTTEICDGIDTNCNRTVDEDPNDCESGRCTADGDGTYSAIAGGVCTAGACGDGTVSDCALYTCSEGGEEGTTCATECAPTGTDDDSFCIESAHCEAGTCVEDVPDGGTCDEDSDCSVGRCDNGFCCGTGTCCSTTADCPGGGGVARVCTDSLRCQGSRGETTCSATFQCDTVSGIADDTACGSSTRALDCGLYDPIFCNGTEDQTAPVCPTSCVSDGQCVDDAHCEFGDCVRDRPAGGVCARPQDCADGLFCVDGLCCNTACNGTCEACNLPGSQGACTPVPAMADPAGECPGFTCSSYFDGFGAGEDACYSRQPVSDSLAACNGAGACIAPQTLCPLQPRGALQIDCNNSCQAPVAGTCSGTTAGACSNLDDPTDLTTCGRGACTRSVQRCVGGLPQTCTPGTPEAEVCNTIDDDCDGTPDDGSGASLCPAAPFAASYSCVAGTCSFTCIAGQYDLNGGYTDGCECTDDSSANSCAAATVVGSISAGASMTITGVIVPNGEEDWYSVNFPLTSRGPAGGNPQIRLTGATASNFELDFYTACGATMSCGTGLPTGVGAWAFVDNQSSGTRAYVGPHTVAWPSSVVFRVRRVATTTSCAQASYSVTISR